MSRKKLVCFAWSRSPEIEFLKVHRHAPIKKRVYLSNITLILGIHKNE